MTYKLKPCPLCGGEVNMFWGDCHNIQCSVCNIGFRGEGGMRKNDVITSWNNNGKIPEPTTSLTHVEIVHGGVCADCGYPAIRTTTNNNHPMSYQGWDYWQYCTNKGCRNHMGEGYAQYNPDWFVECAE
jgi:hypothetical protein